MQQRSINRIEHQTPLTLATYEFPAPRNLAQNEVLLNILRIDSAIDNPDDRLVPSDVAVVALETQISMIADRLNSIAIRSEQDVAATCIDGAEAIAGLLAVPNGITDEQRRDELVQQMANWLKRAELSSNYLKGDVPIHRDWNESVATIMSQNARFFSDPNQGMRPYTTILRRTLDRIDIEHRIIRLKSAATEPSELGQAFADRFGEEQTPEELATAQANALFEYSTRLDEDQIAIKRYSLESAISIISASFVDLDIERDSLNFDQLKRLRIYGQALHDYVELLPDKYSDTAVALRERSVKYLTVALTGISAEIAVLDGQTMYENSTRQQLSDTALEFQRESFREKRETVARLYKELFGLTLQEKEFIKDIEHRRKDIARLDIEEEELRHRLDEIEAGRPDPLQEEFDNPDDERSIAERITSRLDGIMRTRPEMSYDLSRIRGLLYSKETEIIDLQLSIDAEAAKLTVELDAIIREVNIKSDPLRQQLLSNSLGHLEHGNLAYKTIDNALDAKKQRDLADHFSIVYTGELILIRDEVARRREIARRAISDTSDATGSTTLQRAA